jgi:hypothetical protein
MQDNRLFTILCGTFRWTAKQNVMKNFLKSMLTTSKKQKIRTETTRRSYFRASKTTRMQKHRVEKEK